MECEPPERLCPGPSECSHFKSAAQDSPDEEENEKNRDVACAAMGTRCARRVSVDAGLIGQVERVELLVRELRAGLQVDEESLTTWERAGIAWWREIEESFRRDDARVMRELHLIIKARAEAGY